MNKEIFEQVIDKISSSYDKAGNALNMSSIIVSDRDREYSHYFRQKERVDIRSIAKPITCLAVGAAIEKGLFFENTKISLETPIWQFLSKYTKIDDPKNQEKWNCIKLIDCLRITLGHDKGIMFSSDLKGRDKNELVSYIVNYPVSKEIGKGFVYSNAGTFLISTLVTEYLGVNLDEFVSEHLFAPMAINDFWWKKYGKYTAGCTGLEMQNDDLHKIGKLLLNNGIFEDKQLVPCEWIVKMRSPQIPSPTHRYIADRAYPKWSYGMNLWVCKNGIYYCDGSEGQYLIVIPKKKLVITAMGHQKDTEALSSCLGDWK